MTLLPSFLGLEHDCGFGAELVDDLAACAAGGAGDALVVDDGDGANFDFGAEFCHGGEDCSALGAVGEAVGGVLNVAASEEFALGRQEGGADAEVGIGGVGVLHDFTGGAEEAFVFIGEGVLLCSFSGHDS